MRGTRLKPLACEGSYFQLYDYSEISDECDFAFCERMVKEFGVATIPVSRMYSDYHDDKLVSFCFAKTDDVLLAAGSKLSAL